MAFLQFNQCLQTVLVIALGLAQALRLGMGPDLLFTCRFDALAEGVFGRFFVFQGAGDTVIAFSDFLNLKMYPVCIADLSLEVIADCLASVFNHGELAFQLADSVSLLVNGFGFYFQFVFEAFNLLFAAGKLGQDILHSLISDFQLAREMVLLTQKGIRFFGSCCQVGLQDLDLVLQVLFQVAALRDPFGQLVSSFGVRRLLAGEQSHQAVLLVELVPECFDLLFDRPDRLGCGAMFVAQGHQLVLLDHPVVFQQQLFFLGLGDGLLVLVNRIQNQGDFLGFEFVRQTQELPGSFCLLVQWFDPFRQLLDDIIDPDQVLLGLEQFALGFFFPGLEFDNAGRFFKYPPPVFRPMTQNIIHPALADDRITIAAQSGVHEQCRDVLEPDDCLVEKIFAVPGAIQASRHTQLCVFHRQRPVGIIKSDADLGITHRPARLSAGENDILHARTAQGLDTLLPQHPTDGVCDIGLATAIGTDDRCHPGVEVNHGALRKGFETLDLQCFQMHGSDPWFMFRIPRHPGPGSLPGYRTDTSGPHAPLSVRRLSCCCHCLKQSGGHPPPRRL